MVKKQKDIRKEPINKIVALGDSITWGFCTSQKEKCWVNKVTTMLEEFQDSKIQLINQGMGGNVLTPKCPSYDYSSKPSGIERIESHIIAHQPDMIFLAYGLNDSRGGTSPEIFRKEYQKLINKILEKINPVIILINTYYMHEEIYNNCENWEDSDYYVTEVYNLIIKQLAEKNNLILADIYSTMIGVDWIIDNDHCHPNDLGHTIIANKVFESIVRNYSFTAFRSPKKSLSNEFVAQYGNGPDIP